MARAKKYVGKTVFGLDIGTRSIVGTVGYKKGDDFIVMAQRIKEHETRAMLDGQIHDIEKVGNTIADVKEELEKATGLTLKDVCIAAAGRVLKTVTVHADLEFDDPREITPEDVYALKSLGIQNAYETFAREQQTQEHHFYCVGNSVIRYYMNKYQIVNPEGHKAASIGADIIATFLPDDVIDGLYKAVAYADLQVANLTLEPIAAIRVAIPENFRMLNLALVDVGAGTSDICITEDGSITAYGMIPSAGDGLTEIIVKHCLVDFATAEQIKRGIGDAEEVEYTDIIGLPQKITKEKVLEITDAQVDELAGLAADKIKELNGDKPVSAVFVVGGGGKIPGYTQRLSQKLGIAAERSVLRGQEVMGNIIFEEETKKDSTLVTPVGICLCYYDQNNNFIFVSFNDKRIKLYDNERLAVVDAALQADFPNEKLFPRRGESLQFTVNKKKRLIKGQLGEPAVITVNGTPGNIYTPIHENDQVVVLESTAGSAGAASIANLPEFRDTISVQVGDDRVSVPRFALVNNAMKTGYYEIEQGDIVEIPDYCTVAQLLEVLDLVVPETDRIFVNHKPAERDTKVYGNYLVSFGPAPEEDVMEPDTGEEEEIEAEIEAEPKEKERKQEKQKETYTTTLQLTVNKKPMMLTGKAEYVYVDVFEQLDMDLSKPQGTGIVTTLNGRDAQYMEKLHNHDVLEIYWRED